MSQRKYLIAVCALFLFLFAGRQSFAQIDVRTIDMNKVNQDKVDGKLNGTERYVNYQANPNPFPEMVQMGIHSPLLSVAIVGYQEMQAGRFVNSMEAEEAEARVLHRITGMMTGQR